MGPRWESKFELRPGKWVFVPSPEAVRAGRRIKSELEKRWKPPSYFFHLKDGGHVAALRAHLGNTSFVHVDIKDFFNSINRTRVTRCLKGLYSYNDARDIAIFSTVIHPGMPPPTYILPYGFVQSPLLASICLHESALGKYLQGLSRKEGVRVSVYVDDIVISTSDGDLSSSILDKLKQVAVRARFALNDLKEEGPAAQIAAFNIELSRCSLVIQPDRWKKFVQALRESQNEHQRKGILGYVSSVSKEQARQLLIAT